MAVHVYSMVKEENRLQHRKDRSVNKKILSAALNSKLTTNLTIDLFSCPLTTTLPFSPYQHFKKAIKFALREDYMLSFTAVEVITNSSQ